MTQLAPEALINKNIRVSVYYFIYFNALTETIYIVIARVLSRALPAKELLTKSYNFVFIRS